MSRHSGPRGRHAAQQAHVTQVTSRSPGGEPLAPRGNRGDPGDMTTSTIAPAGHRPEAGGAAVSAAAVTATPGAGERGPSPRPRRPWWRRLWAPSFPGQSADEYQRATLEQLLALLEAAREELTAGWVQDGWWSVSGGGRQVLAIGLAAGVSRPGPVDAVCLVGALVRAGSRQRPGGQDPGGQDPGGQDPGGQNPGGRRPR